MKWSEREAGNVEVQWSDNKSERDKNKVSNRIAIRRRKGGR
jgi:hypothetical protein